MKFVCDKCGSRNYGYPTYITDGNTYCSTCYNASNMGIFDLVIGFGMAMGFALNILPFSSLDPFILLVMQICAYSFAFGFVAYAIRNALGSGVG